MAAASSPESPPTILADYDPDSPFQCCVCLDLLYKPIVIACGHISCFWCVHRAMNGDRESHCALCRRPYSHFPNICLLLHALLLKLEPVAYKRRQLEVLENERQRDVFSPQFSDLDNEKVNSDNNQSGTSAQICVDDVLCSLCKGLLYQPVVLNCGHVYCQSCISGVTTEPICHICQCLHPGKLPNVCLDLDHFLEVQFPEEYERRREQVPKTLAQCCQADQSSSSSLSKGQDGGNITGENLVPPRPSSIHYCVGCDCCGMYPILGKRYKCKDCKVAIGFDLCESCYNTNSKLPGKFNQQHTADHQFELCSLRLFDTIGRVIQLSTIMVNEFRDASPIIRRYPSVQGNEDEEDSTGTPPL